MRILETMLNVLRNLVTSDMTPEQVEGRLQEIADASTERLNWKHSIVDLLKLLDLDSSLAARRELAADLGYEGGFDGTPEQNTELHRRVLQEVAKHNIRLPDLNEV